MKKEKKKIVIILSIIVIISLSIFGLKKAFHQSTSKEKIVIKEFHKEKSTVYYAVTSSAVSTYSDDNKVEYLENNDFNTIVKYFKTDIEKDEFIDRFIYTKEVENSYYNTQKSKLSCPKEFICSMVSFQKKEPQKDSSEYIEKTYNDMILVYPKGKDEYFTIEYIFEDTLPEKASINELISKSKVDK